MANETTYLLIVVVAILGFFVLHRLKSQRHHGMYREHFITGAACDGSYGENPNACKQCPDSGCCYKGQCAPPEVCFGFSFNKCKSGGKNTAPGPAGAIGAPCWSSDCDQCATGCCFEGKCAEAAKCFGDGAVSQCVRGNQANTNNGNTGSVIQLKGPLDYPARAKYIAEMPQGASMVPGDNLSSPSGNYRLELSTTSVGLVLYKWWGSSGWGAVWQQGIPSGSPPRVLDFQNDGNIVMKDSNGQVVWQTQTYYDTSFGANILPVAGGASWWKYRNILGDEPKTLILQDDGNLFVRGKMTGKTWWELGKRE